MAASKANTISPRPRLKDGTKTRMLLLEKRFYDESLVARETPSVCRKGRDSGMNPEVSQRAGVFEKQAAQRLLLYRCFVNSKRSETKKNNVVICLAERGAVSVCLCVLTCLCVNGIWYVRPPLRT